MKADEDEDASNSSTERRSVSRFPQRETADLLVTVDAFDDRVDQELDLRMACAPRRGGSAGRGTPLRRWMIVTLLA